MKTRDQIEKTFVASRGTMIAVFALTCVNIVLLLTNSDFYFLFSASLPQIALFLNSTFNFWTGEYTFATLSIVLAFVATLPYLGFWFASSKNKMWILAALVYFVIDLIVLAFLVARAGGFGEFDFFIIVELAFFVWILVSLILGTKAWLDSKKLPPPSDDFGQAPPQNHI